MNKKAISVTLRPENLVWLRAQSTSRGYRSVSEMLDLLISEARKHDDSPPRSVLGRLIIDPDDPDLQGADAAVRALFSV